MIRKAILLGIAVCVAVLGGVVAFLAVFEPLPCRSREHVRWLGETWAAWRRGELAQHEMLQELVRYAEMGPAFGEKATFREGNTFGGYFSVHSRAFEYIGELDTEEAFAVLCNYATCPDRLMNSYAVTALRKRGDKEAMPVLVQLLELEDQRQAGTREIIPRNPHLLTCHTLDAIKTLAGREAIPVLQGFLAAKNRKFEREVRITLFELEHDTSKPINVEHHVVTIHLNKRKYARGEEMMLEYSATTPPGTPSGRLSAFGTTVAIDGKVIMTNLPNVYYGGFWSRGAISLEGVAAGEHTITVAITGTDKSDSSTFSIEDESADHSRPAAGDTNKGGDGIPGAFRGQYTELT